MKKTTLLVQLANALFCFGALAQNTGSILLKNATVIDGTGSPARANTDILVTGGQITSIEKGIKANGAREIDLTGKTVMPSLICAHAHVGTLKGTTSSADNYTRDNLLRHLKKYEDYGVSAVLALGTDRPLIFNGFTDSTQAGLLPGARLYSAGYGFNTVDEPAFTPQYTRRSTRDDGKTGGGKTDGRQDMGGRPWRQRAENESGNIPGNYS